MGSFVRRVKTASGATAVQIVHKRGRQVVGIDHIGSAHDEDRLVLLLETAKQRLHADQQALERLLIQFADALPPDRLDGRLFTQGEALAWAHARVGAAPAWLAYRLSAVRQFAVYLAGSGLPVGVPGQIQPNPPTIPQVSEPRLASRSTREPSQVAPAPLGCGRAVRALRVAAIGGRARE